jgi:hypothetical protein
MRLLDFWFAYNASSIVLSFLSFVCLARCRVSENLVLETLARYHLGIGSVCGGRDNY